MAIEVSRASLQKAAHRGEKAVERLKRLRKEGEHVVGKILRTGETAGTAFGFGLLNGYHGPISVAKIPLEVIVGGVAELGGWLGLAGKHSDHLNNIGDGALAAYAVVKGVQVGAEMKAKHAGGSGTKTSGNALTSSEIRQTLAESLSK